MKRFVLPLLLVLAAIGAYSGLLAAGDLRFVFDDIRFVRDNPAIRDLDRIPDFFTDPSTVDASSWAGIYRPLRTLDFAFDYAIAGTTAGGVRWFHLKSVAYHAVGTLLLFFLFRQWGAGRRSAALGALLFALHPVQTEAVAWISSRGDVLCLVLFLAALLLHGRSRGADRWFAASAGCLFLALLAKEAAVVFTGVALLTDFAFRDGRSLRTTIRRWPKYVAFLAVTGLYILLWINRHQAFGEDGLGGAPVFERLSLSQLLTVARAFVYYARLIVLPVDLALDFYLAPVESPGIGSILTAVLVLGVLLWAARAVFRTGSLLAFAVLWFVIAIFPTSGLPVPLGTATTERFLYLPLVGFAFFGGHALCRIASRGGRGVALVGTVLGCLFVLTFARAQIWTDPDALWDSTRRFFSPRGREWQAERAREQAEGLGERARELRDRGDLEAADRLEEQAEALLLGAVEDYDELVRFWERASPRWEPVLISISLQAVCLHDLQRFEECLARANFCLGHWPDMELGHYARSLGLSGVGRLEEAAREIEQAIAIAARPNYREAGARIYEELGRSLEQQGLRERAYEAYRRSFELLPSETENAKVLESLRRLDADRYR